MALNQWFKFYGGEYLSDPKIAALSPAKRSCWITVLALASISSTPGQIEYLTVEVLLDKSGVKFDPYDMTEWNSCLGVLEEFVRMKMISKSDDGLIAILNWKKRQDTALTNAERQAKYRERNEKVTGDVTKVTRDKIRIDKNRNTIADAKVDSLEETEFGFKEADGSGEVLAAFREFNPLLGNRKTYADSCRRMIAVYGLETVLNVVHALPEINKMQFVTKVTTPPALEDNWVKMQAQLSSGQEAKKIKKPHII